MWEKRQARGEIQGAECKGKKPGAEARTQNPESHTQSKERRDDERGSKSKEFGMNNPMSPPNPVTKVCSCLRVCFVSVIERLCVYVCAGV